MGFPFTHTETFMNQQSPPRADEAKAPEHGDGHASSDSAGKKKGRLALLWSISGTLVSVVGFIALALFEQYNGMLSELRTDLKHFNSISSEFAKRESLQRLRDQMKERNKEFQEANAARVRLENELKISERAREELVRDMQKIRERISFVEGQQFATSAMQKAMADKDNGSR